MDDLPKREYSPDIQRVWRKEIAEAERLVQSIEADPLGNGCGYYVVKLDPEDFLDLCAGKWHNV